LDEQPHNLSKESNDLLIENQDNIQDDQDSLLAYLNVGNLEESLPSSSTEKVSKIQGKTLPKVRNDNTVVKMVALNDELQKSRKNDMKEVQKSIQRLYQKFSCLCSLISDLLNILHPKISSKSTETTINSENFHVTPLQLITVTNAFAERISGNPVLKRILMTKNPSQIRCYECNMNGHIARYCHSRKTSNFGSNKFRYTPKYQKEPLGNVDN